MDSSSSASYRTHPVHIFPWLDVGLGHDALAEMLCQQVCSFPKRQLLVIDGFVGVQWEIFIAELRDALNRRTRTRWFSTNMCFRPTDEITQILAPSLTKDPVFGRLFHGHLEELWRAENVAELQNDLEVAYETEDEDVLLIVYGFGASRITEAGVHMYVDVPKDRGQQLAAQKEVVNVGANEPDAFAIMYKHFYFVDWPMLNRIKHAALYRINVLVDATESTAPRFMQGSAFRRALHELSAQPFRLKPWFAPGPWGGQWMKERFGLPLEQPNYAWSFELIAPENGVLLGNEEQSLECSFDYLLWAETEAVLGVSVAARYGSYFPIRFDYLDTMGGTNLSCQVHPHVDYIRNEFGEVLTQDETYYIVANTPEAKVFLGLRDDADVTHFEADAIAARDSGIPFDIATHVASMESKPHDLFLIPSGTVHCSGVNNLVLEISATPYIYTFKIYDYLRNDLAGNLRHVHLDHAFANIDATHTETWVKAHLRPEPVLLRAELDGKEYVLENNEQLFFAIHRFEFTDTIADQTQGKFQVLNLVEGECCEIVSKQAEPFELRFAESVIIPASLGAYQLRNLGQSTCKVVKAFVKG